MTNIELLTVKVNCHHHAIAIATNIAREKGCVPNGTTYHAIAIAANIETVKWLMSTRSVEW
jgi:hypothetical protein